MKKLLLCVLAFFCVFAMVGCGKKTNEGTNVIQDDSDPNAPNLEGEVIRLLTEDTWLSGFSLSDILPRFKQIEARTGCTIIWNTIPGGSDYSSVVQTRIAAADKDSPDIVLTDSNLNNIAEYIQQGLVYNYKDAYDVCPNIKRFWDNRDDLAKIFTYNDGGIYNLLADVYDSKTGMKEYYSVAGDNALWYRADIAAELGFTEPPKTINELHDLLLAVKQAYPSMVPMHMWNWDCWESCRVFTSAYGLHWNNENFADYFYPDEEGNVVYEPILDATKEFLAEMNKWYREGLIIVGSSEEQKIGAAASGRTFSGFYAGVVEKCQDILQESNPNAYFMYMQFPTAEGHELTYMGRIEYSKSVIIINNGDEDHCKKVAQFLDYAFMSDYGIASERAGVQGVGWDYDEDGKFTLNQDWLNKICSGQEVAQSSGAGVHFNGPSLNNAQMNLAYDKSIEDYIAAHPEIHNPVTPAQKANWIEINTYNVAHYCAQPPKFYMSDEDLALFNRYSGDLGTFTSEMITKYILGSEDLSNFDTKFKDRLYSRMHLQDCIDILQKYYDVYFGKTA